MRLVERKSFPRGGWLLAAAATLAISGTGIAAATVPATADDATSSSACAAVNPMGAATPIGSEDGYTIFVKEDSILANAELEGSLAVVGTATFGSPQNSANDYVIMHSSGNGNADYNVPTIEGQPNRLLIQEFKPYGSKIAKVEARGATGDNALAGAKIGKQDTPADYTFGPMFGGTSFYPESGDHNSPQVASLTQPWTDLAAAQKSWGIDSDVGSLFPADTGASALESYEDWATVAAPTGTDQAIELDGKHASKLPLSAFTQSNAAKFTINNYNQNSFLIITVDSSDVVDGVVTLPAYAVPGKDSPGNQGISHVLFDFSEISGDVSLKSMGEPIRGAIYAPEANVTLGADAPEFEGQVVAKNFTALQQREIHTNLFHGRFPCADEPQPVTGTFSMQKVLDGVDAGVFPEGTTFPVTATWSDDEGEQQSKMFDLPADGSTVAAGVELPKGTVVTLAEGELPAAPEGYSFVSKELSADTVTILADDNANIAWTVTNTYAKDEVPAATGSFSMQKMLDGVDAGVFQEGTTFPVTATWSGDQGEQSQTFELPADGSTVAADVDLPEGTVVTLAEGDLPEAPEGYSFVSKELSADTITILADDNENIAWTVTNTYTAEPDNPTEEPSEPTEEPSTPSESVTTPGVTDSPSDKPGDMPNTGAQGTLLLIVGGLVLVVAGTAAVLAARRRQTAQG